VGSFFVFLVTPCAAGGADRHLRGARPTGSDSDGHPPVPPAASNATI
jgi:hypothetical protein